MVWYTDPSVDLTLHLSLTHEQDFKIPKLLHLRQNFSTNLDRAYYPFLVKASDLIELIVLPAASHLAVNRASMCWAKPLCQKILSIKIMNQVQDLPLCLAPENLDLKLKAATSVMEAENMVHFDSISPASLGIPAKLFWMWKTSLTEDSARRSQQTCTMGFVLPGL